MKQTQFPKVVVLMISVVGILGLLLFAGGQAAQAVGVSSNAAAAVYNDGWQTGDNDGSGFDAWTLYTSGSAGHFIYSSTANGDGDSNLDSDIDTSGEAWGMWSEGMVAREATIAGGTAGAARPLSSALSAGQTLSFKFDNGWIESCPIREVSTVACGGTVGFHLQNSAQQIVMEVYFAGGGSFYMFGKSGSAPVSTGIGFTDEGLTASLDLGPSNAYTFTLTGLAGGTFTNSGTLPNPGSGANISRLYFYSNYVGGGASHNLYINDMVIDFPPDAKNDAVETDENAVYNGDLLVDNGNGADSDPDSTSLTTALLLAPAKGLAVVNGDGSFSFDPNGEFNSLMLGSSEVITFTYTLKDEQERMDTATVSVQVNGITKATITSASVIPEPSMAGEEALLTATVSEDPCAREAAVVCRSTDTAPVGPTGTVTFTVESFFAGTGSLNSGTATYSYTFSAPGMFLVCAEYGSDSESYADSGPSCAYHTVNQDTEIDDVWVTPEPSLVYSQTTLSALVSPVEIAITRDYDSTVLTLTGSVTFTVAGNPVGSAPIDFSGQADLLYTFNGPGQYLVCATFTPDPGYFLAPAAPSCTTHSVLLETQTTVTVTPEPSEEGEETEFEATVSPIWPPSLDCRDSACRAPETLLPLPGGIVTFTVEGSEVATATLLSGGTAAYSHTFPTAGEYEVCAFYGPTSDSADYYKGSSDCTMHTVEEPPLMEVLYLSSDTGGTVSGAVRNGGLAFADEDIVRFDGTVWTMYFDGSDVGLSLADIDAFTILPNGNIILSLDIDLLVTGAGKVADEDLVLFVPTMLGPTTAGTFSMYFDGSDVALTTTSEDIDSVEVLADGSLLISTWGDFVVSGVSGGDEDLIKFKPTTLGGSTSGTFSMYFDGSDVGLTLASENTNGAWSDGAGKLYLSTLGNFAVPGVSGEGKDVFVCTQTSIGATTACTFDPTLAFDGSAHGFPGSIDGLHRGMLTPPTRVGSASPSPFSSSRPAPTAN